MTGADDEDTTDRLARLELSEAGERFLKGQTAGWGKHLELGTNLLIDAFLQEKHWADDLREAIHNSGAKVINVVMTCNETELERREKQRGDRFPGMARHSADVVHKHKHGETDLGIDETISTDDAVNSILHRLDGLEASVNDTPGQAALSAPPGDVIKRLQRAMESRSRLEAENRRKLQLDSRRKEEGRNQREVEAAERRRAKDVAEAREKDEKRRRHMKLQQARREQEHAQRAAEEEQNRMRRLLVEQGKYERQSLANAAKRKSLNTVRSVEEKKQRLQKFIAKSAVTLANEISASVPVQGRQTHLTSEECDSQDSKKHTKSGKCISYEISPYRSGSDTDEDEERPYPRKPIPDWARTDALVAVLTKQASVDPDEIFQNTTKTCSLGAVFTSHMERTCSRRSSSGDWFSDRLTWREELTYKKDMGFMVNK